MGVAAQNGVGEGAFSDVASFTTDPLGMYRTDGGTPFVAILSRTRNFSNGYNLMLSMWDL